MQSEGKWMHMKDKLLSVGDDISMEDILRTRLYEDEQLLWYGIPEPFKMLDKTNRASIIGSAIIKALAAQALMVLCFFIFSESTSLKLVSSILILAFGIYTQSEPFLIVRRLRNETLYILTDRRILRIGTKYSSMPYEKIIKAAIRTDEDGHYSVLCGEEIVSLKSRYWRDFAASDVIAAGNSDDCACMVLYALPMDEKLREVLNSNLQVS